MNTEISCPTHGSQRLTRVCRHILDTLVDRQPRGMFWTSDEADEPNAWCKTCHALYLKAGEEWTDELMAQVDVQPLCFGCFQLAKKINGFGAN